MTNPNNAIGTNAAFSGRTSPNALNDITASFTAGIVSGWECVPKTGMTVQLGGQAGTRDVALAEDNAGNKLTINNRSGAPVEVTLPGAPSTNNRVDAIVAYVDNPSTGDDNTTDNPTTCGIIAVSGTVAANPTAPSEATIRSAITTDGATGGTAYYIILATIYVGTNVTTIGSGVITAGTIAQVAAAQNQAATNAQTSADALASALNMTQFGTISKSDCTITNLSGGAVTMRYAVNADGTVGKLYGTFMAFQHNKSGQDATITFNTPFRPSQNIDINGACVMIEVGINTVPTDAVTSNFITTFKPNGDVTLTIGSYWYNRKLSFYFAPCIYFMKDFGDTPLNP